MKGINEHQVILLQNFISKKANDARNKAEQYRNKGSFTSAMMCDHSAAEIDCILAYLQGILEFNQANNN